MPTIRPDLPAGIELDGAPMTDAATLTNHAESWLRAARACALEGDVAGTVRCIDNVLEP